VKQYYQTAQEIQARQNGLVDDNVKYENTDSVGNAR
jgi:hypothetical protein